MRPANSHSLTRDLSPVRRWITLGAAAVLSVCAVWFGHTLVRAAASTAVQQASAFTASKTALNIAAQPGDRVTANYTGKLSDGQVFDSSAQSGPVTFTVGDGEVVPGFENAVIGLHAGDSVTVQVDPAQGYGQPRSDLVVTVPASQAPAGLQVGERVTLSGRPAVVTQVDANGVTVDANSPLAGKVLTFQISVLSVDRPGDQVPPAPLR